MFKNIEFSVKKKQEAFLMSIWNKNSQRIYQNCLKICNDQETAKDLQQEVFIKIFKHVHVFKDYDNKDAWIQFVCRNHCLDFLRRQKARPEFIANENMGSYEVVGDDFKSEQALFYKLEQVLMTLNILDRMILELYFIGGMNGDDISKCLGLSKTSVSLKIKKALNKASFFFNNDG
ncbi:MAG: sigma-70 family RNA polymerase sigma factor [Fibrobacter sp.]|jgi:RNA polymerase sigma factor (sigma-70 family)|nr:sigma-70 family RNA polymerase sigma factor [Fibrobacter sp.]